MYIMFELFGSSSEKKEEINKNVEEIRSIVEGSDQSQTTTEGPQRKEQPQSGVRKQQETEKQAKANKPQTPQRGQNQGPTDQPRKTANDTVEMNSGSSQDDLPPPPGRTSESNNTSGQRAQDTQESPIQAKGQFDTASEEDNEESRKRNIKQNIPDAPEKKEINVPEIEKGPLFIRVKKFKEAKKLIHQMQDMTENVETDMGGLQNTLEEDRKVERDLKGTLKKLRDSMKNIHTIVSP